MDTQALNTVIAVTIQVCSVVLGDASDADIAAAVQAAIREHGPHADVAVLESAALEVLGC